MDLYAQCGFMDKSLLGFDSYYSFQGRYAVTKTQRMGSHSFLQIVGYRNLEELSEKLDTFSYRVTKEEALDLPDKVYVTREVSVTDEQRQHYLTLKKQAIAMFDNGDLVTACLLYTSPSPRDATLSRMPSSA